MRMPQWVLNWSLIVGVGLAGSAIAGMATIYVFNIGLGRTPQSRPAIGPVVNLGDFVR